MIGQIIDNIFFIYMIMLFIKILGSWLPEFSHTQFMLFISYCTNPYLNFFRRFIPPLGMMDLSPIAAFFCLQIIQGLFKSFIYSIL